MITVFEANLGYVKCDICGDASIQMFVERGQDGRFTLTYESRCFDNPKVSDLDRDGLAEAITGFEFMIHTRRARALVRQFLTELRRGKHDMKVEHKVKIAPERAEAMGLASAMQGVGHAAQAAAYAMSNAAYANATHMAAVVNEAGTWAWEPLAQAVVTAPGISIHRENVTMDEGWFVE